MTQIKTVLNTRELTPDLEAVSARLAQLVQIYGETMVQGVYLSKDLNPNMLEVLDGKLLSYNEKNSEVLRLHLQNLHNTYSNAIINQARAIILNRKAG